MTEKENKETDDRNIPQSPSTAVQNAADKKIVEVDLMRFAAHIEDLDLTESERIELLRTAWSIAHAFVDLGFGIASPKACGQFLDVDDCGELQDHSMIKSSDLNFTLAISDAIAAEGGAS